MAKKMATTTDRPRKLKRKKKETKAPVSVSVLASRSLKAIATVLSAETGFQSIHSAGSAGVAVIGLALPSFCLEYLMQINVWPLNRVVQAVGEKGSCKSAFTFEVVRWFRQNQGVGFLNENETKYSPQLALSIMGYPKSADDESLVVATCDSLESWQIGLSKQVKWIKTIQKEKGKLFPVILIVDSIMGSLSQDTIKAIEKAGHAERAYAVEALKITQYLKAFPATIVQNPISLLCVNHLKLAPIDQFRSDRNIAGGKHVGFQETFELEFSDRARYTKRAEDSKGRKILNIGIRCWKNSLGETGKEILVPFWWTFKKNPETGERRQFSTWDWSEATARLILDQSKDPKKKRDLDDIVGMRKVRSGRSMVYISRPLGISKSDELNLTEFGKAIDDNAAVRRALREYYGIHEFSVYKPGIDFTKQTKAVKEQVVKAISAQDKALKEAADDDDFVEEDDNNED